MDLLLSKAVLAFFMTMAVHENGHLSEAHYHGVNTHIQINGQGMDMEWQTQDTRKLGLIAYAGFYSQQELLDAVPDQDLRRWMLFWSGLQKITYPLRRGDRAKQQVCSYDLDCMSEWLQVSNGSVNRVTIAVGVAELVQAAFFEGHSYIALGETLDGDPAVLFRFTF